MKQLPPETSCLICRIFDPQPKCRQVPFGMRAEGIEDLANVHLVHMSTACAPRDFVHRSSSQGDAVPAAQHRSSGSSLPMGLALARGPTRS